jgi:hypothetical protein
MHDGCGKNAACFAPRAAVENSRNRSQQGVTPVGKNSIVVDVRQSKNQGGHDPATSFAR